MTLIAIIVILFLISVIAVVWRTEQLNVDPLQDQLQVLVAELVSADFSPEAKRRFSELAAAYFHRFRLDHLPTPKLRLRLVHALSTLMHRLPAAQFKKAEKYFLTWEMPPFTPPRHGHPRTAPTSSGTADIFVSYAREEASAVRIIVAQLQASGLSIWWDDGIETGSRWSDAINERLTSSKAVVVLWSPLASVSEWVKREAEYAKANNKLVPVFIRKCQLPGDFGEIQTLDLSRWHGHTEDAEWQKLIAAVSRLSGS